MFVFPDFTQTLPHQKETENRSAFSYNRLPAVNIVLPRGARVCRSFRTLHRSDARTPTSSTPRPDAISTFRRHPYTTYPRLDAEPLAMVLCFKRACWQETQRKDNVVTRPARGW
jgi:hypothetical protein